MSRTTLSILQPDNLCFLKVCAFYLNQFSFCKTLSFLSSGLPSTIQYAARAAAPISQQATIGFVPGQVVGQTPGQAPNAVANARVAQLDGHNDDSSSDDDDEDEYRDNDDDDNDDEMNDEENDGGIEDEVPIATAHYCLLKLLFYFFGTGAAQLWR